MYTFILKQGDAEAALLGFESLRLEDPTAFPPGMGHALLALSRRDEAARYFEAAMTAEPENDELARQVANTYRRSGQHDEALSVWRRIHAPTTADRLGEAHALAEVEGPEQALEALESTRLSGLNLSDKERLLKADLERRLGFATECARTLSGVSNRVNAAQVARLADRCARP